MNPRSFLCSIVAAAAVFSLAACHSDSSNNAQPKKGTIDMQDVTDTSSCVGATPAATTIENSWTASKVTGTHGGFSATITFLIMRDMTLITKTCSSSVDNITTSVTVTSSHTGSTYNILKGSSNSAKFRTKSETLDCGFNVTPTSLNYSFQGPCLILNSTDGPKILLVPTTPTVTAAPTDPTTTNPSVN